MVACSRALLALVAFTVLWGPSAHCRAVVRGSRSAFSSQQSLAPGLGMSQLLDEFSSSDESNQQHEAKASQDTQAALNPLRMRAKVSRTADALSSAAMRTALRAAQLRSNAALPHTPSLSDSGCPPPGTVLPPQDMNKYPGCGLLSANVTREVRIGYREWLLPFTGSPTADQTFVPTSSDPREHLLVEDVLRVADERPLDQGGDLSKEGIVLRAGYPGMTGKEVPVYGTNLVRLPGLCDVVKGAARVRTSKDVRAILKEGDTVVFPMQLDGRSVVAGSLDASGFEVDEELSRLTRVGLPCYRVDPDKGPRTHIVPQDLGDVINSIQGEAEAEFGGQGIDCDLLPGMLTMTRDDLSVGSTEDLQPYIFPMAVMGIDVTYPHVVSPMAAITQTQFAVLDHWKLDSGKYPGCLTRYRVLPGLADATQGKHCVSVNADVTDIVAPGDVVMIDRSARLVVAFQRPPPGTPGELLTGDGPTVTESVVCLSHPFPGDTVSQRAWYFHDGERLLDPSKLKLKVTPGSTTVEVVGPADAREFVRARDELRLFCDDVQGRAKYGVAGFPEPMVAWPASSKVLVAPEDGAAVTTHSIELAEGWGGAASPEPGCLVMLEGRRMLPGAVDVTHDTAVWAPSADLRELLVTGDVVRAGIYRDTAVAGGDAAPTSGVPGDIRTAVTREALQTLVPHPGKTEKSLPLSQYYYRQLPCNVTVQQGSPVVTTLCDMTDVLLGLSVLRIQVYRRLIVASSVDVPAITPTSFLLSKPYQGHSKKNIPVYANTLDDQGPSHTHDLAYGKLPGCANVIHDSPYISVTTDITSFVTTGDALRIGTREMLIVAQPPTPRSIRITVPWPGKTEQCLPISRMFRRVELSGALSCEAGSPGCVSSRDVRKEAAIGEVIVIVSKASETGPTRVSEATGTPLRPNEREFTIVTPYTATEVTLSEAYTGPTEKNMAMFRVIFGSGAGVLLPGFVTVTQGSPYAKTSEDLSGSIRAGETLRLGLREFAVMEPITPSGFTLTVPYTGTSTTGLKAFNLGRTERQVSLEALAALKLRCRSIFCLAKIEELERQTPSELSRSLTAGKASKAVLAALHSDQSAIPYLPTPEEYARGEYTADAVTKRILSEDEHDREDVEHEWSRWFKTAEQSLRGQAELSDSAVAPAPGGNPRGLPNSQLGAMEDAARFAAEARVQELHGPSPPRP
jgi:hypothetical protein